MRYNKESNRKSTERKVLLKCPNKHHAATQNVKTIVSAAWNEGAREPEIEVASLLAKERNKEQKIQQTVAAV